MFRNDVKSKEVNWRNACSHPVQTYVLSSIPKNVERLIPIEAKVYQNFYFIFI